MSNPKRLNPELRKVYAALDECYYDARQSEYKCMYPDCEEKAIKSHIIQKKRYLKNIADEDGNVVEHKMIVSRIRGAQDYFKSIHIGKSSTISLFCHPHDLNLFKSLDSKNDLSTYNSADFAKLKYRNVCAVIRDTEVHMKANDLINKRLELPPELKQKYDDSYYSSLLRIAHLKSRIPPTKALRDEVPYRNIIIELPLIPLAASTQFTYFHANSSKDENHDLVMFNIFPLKEKTLVSYGFPLLNIKSFNDSISLLCNGTRSEILQKISDDLLIRVHHWVCSKQFYNEQIKKRRRVIDHYFKNYEDWIVKQETVPLNLFLNYKY